MKYLEDYHLENLKSSFKSMLKRNYPSIPNNTLERATDSIENVYYDLWRKEFNDAADEAEVKDAQLKDALNAYKQIVQIHFDNVEVEKQNVKNASYFAWAFFTKDKGNAKMGFPPCAFGEDDTGGSDD